jgi:hypothetical protein
VTARPWRAAASYRLGPGFPAVVVGRCYRATERGLDRFVDGHRAAGCTVAVWQVLPLPGVTQGTQVADSPTG